MWTSLHVHPFDEGACQMTAAQVDTFFKDYVRAFVDQDIDRICSFWGYPAFMVFEGRQAALSDKAFRSNAVRLCAFYAVQGVTRAEKEVIFLMRLTDTTTAVRTRDMLYDAGGKIIAEWEHAYLLSDTAEGIRVAAAMPDGEVRAWRERGTPLGA
jgi:hypothetical protein